MKKSPLMLALAFISVLQGQNINFLNSYNTQPIAMHCCRQLNDSTFVTSGFILSPSPQNTFCSYLLKVDNCGDSIAGTVVNPVTLATYDMVVSDIQDLFNGTFLALATEGAGSNEYGTYILKYNYNLQLLSYVSVNYPGKLPIGANLFVANSNTYFITGHNKTNPVYSTMEAIALRCDSLGSVTWFREYGHTAQGVASFMGSTFDPATSDVYINYYEGQSGSNYTLRVNSAGVKLWEKAYTIFPEGFELDYNKNVLVASSDALGEVMIYRLSNVNGDTLFTRSYPFFNLASKRFAKLNSGNMALSASENSGTNTGFIMLLDTALNQIYQADSLMVNPNAFQAITPTSGGGYFICGIEDLAPNLRHTVVVKADDAGCSPVFINELKNTETGIKVFPNPSQQEITISLDNVVENSASFSLYDNAMRLVRSQNEKNLNAVKNSFKFSLEGVKTGIYFLAAKTGGKTFCKKIVVE